MRPSAAKGRPRRASRRSNHTSENPHARTRAGAPFRPGAGQLLGLQQERPHLGRLVAPVAQRFGRRRPGEPVHVVGVVDLVATHDPTTLNRPLTLGVVSTSTPSSARRTRITSRKKPGSSTCSMTSAREVDVGRFEPQVPHRVGTRAVDGVGLVAEAARRGRRRPCRRRAPRATWQAPRQVLVQPRAEACCIYHEPGVDEADVNDTTPVGRQGAREPVDDLRRREPVHHPELGRRVAHAGASTEKSPMRSPRSGLPTQAAQHPPELSTAPRRLYQSRRLPNRPTSGLSQNGSSVESLRWP